MTDPIYHPLHYNSGKIEVIEAIEAIEYWNLGFHLGNVVKYVARSGKKDPTKEVEDLKKARWYLNRKIELLEPDPELREPSESDGLYRRAEFFAEGENI